MEQTLDEGHKGEQDAMDAWAKEHTEVMPEDKEPANPRGVEADPTFRGYMSVVSLDNEESAWRTIEDAVDATLAKYPTTLDEDREILEEDKTENSLGKNKTNCILFRMSEKMVLLQIKDWADKIMQVTRLDMEEAVELVKTWENKGNFYHYFEHTICPLMAGELDDEVEE